MKPHLFFLICIMLSSYANAQVSTDSLQEDSVKQLPELSDSAKVVWHRVDSIRNDFNNQADSLQQEYHQKLSAIDNETNRLNHTIDSLNRLNLPSNKFTNRLDSLNQERAKLDGQFNGKLSKLKSKTLGKLDKVEMTPEMEGPVGEFTQKINGIDLSSNDFVKIPALEVPGYSIPNVEGLGGLSSLGNLNKLGLPQIDTPLGDAGELSKEVQGLREDVKSIAGGDLKNVQHIDKTIENQAGQIEGVQELQKASGVVDAYESKISELNNPEALQQQGLEMAKKEAVNHFAGKEGQLKTAMDKMSKQKQKFSSVKSMKELPKRPPNAMKGKPFIERVVPGIYLQFQVKNAYLFDVNPYVGYRISGRFTSGAGWNRRFAYDKKYKAWDPEKRIYGPRAYVDFRLGRGFNGHLETELMNTYVPPIIRSNQEAGKRQWVSSTMVGIKKQYKIYKNLHGTVLIQYNLYNPYFKAPYLDRLNSRMGFEYTLKKKVKKTEASEEKE